MSECLMSDDVGRVSTNRCCNRISSDIRPSDISKILVGQDSDRFRNAIRHQSQGMSECLMSGDLHISHSPGRCLKIPCHVGRRMLLYIIEGSSSVCLLPLLVRLLSPNTAWTWHRRLPCWSRECKRTKMTSSVGLWKMRPKLDSFLLQTSRAPFPSKMSSTAKSMALPP